jgi:hypothetical protein
MAEHELEDLIATAKAVRMTPEARERQRRSFAYGNTHAENEKITHATVDRAADRLSNGGPKNQA